jgi:lipopolysaccharide biosynthesis glycosyltransferase
LSSEPSHVSRHAAAAQDVVNVALGIDRAYAPHAAATIASIVRNAPGVRLRLLILHSGVERPLRRSVERSAPGMEFVWSEIGDHEAPQMDNREHFSRAILFRLGIETHAPADWSRLIYVDADTIFAADIRELWRTNLGRSPIAGVVDCFIDAGAFGRKWGLPENDAGYFNSGVLLIDLERVRSEQLMTTALDFATSHLSELRFVDQDALNYAFWGRWLRLDTRWNVQRHMVIEALSAELPPDRRLIGQQPAIIHYTGPEKPWVRDGYHPWSWLYWESLSQTPFFAEVAREQRVGPVRRLILWQRWLRRRAIA